MGYQQLSLKIPTAWNNDQIRSAIARALKIRNFNYTIGSKSLDARNRANIHWRMQFDVVSDEIKGGEILQRPVLQIPYKSRKANVTVVGSGPAGFFCAFVLQQAGFKVTLIERGSEVLKRGRAILAFERNGSFDATNNYAFGEGGAGTFSDGKLTSRSKHISKEREFILNSYIKAGGPEEIAWMAHPHLGTDKLKIIVKNLRAAFQHLGGTMLFETLMRDLNIKNRRVISVETTNGDIETDALFIAPGHSAYETYRMLMRNGVTFRTKNFALGSRMEHRQEIINMAQWGRPTLAGVKAAEYRLTSQADGKHQVYSFCMCPGGMVVPAAAYAETNIVNGMSYYERNGRFANAACVAGIHPDELAGRELTSAEALDWLENLERTFFRHTGNYQAPACTIQEFLGRKLTSKNMETSFPLGLQALPLWEFLPRSIVDAMYAGLKEFASKMKGFENGTLIGLESKTSSPIQVLREEGGLCSGFENLYLIGEGSGYAGGIISSAADGVKAALRFAEV